MNTCLFLVFRLRGDLLSRNEISEVEDLLRAVPRLANALIHTSAAANDPYVKDDDAPQLVLQLYFDALLELEAATSHSSLQELGSRERFPVLRDAEITQQVMLVRTFVVPEPKFRNQCGAPYCTYLVSYEGEAQDINDWLRHYLESHIPHMTLFPGLRELEVYTRLDAVSALPWLRLNFMQRNKVAFDSPEALTQALHSPIRHAMRADFKTFPPFTGPTRHYAMATRMVRL